MQFGPMQKTNKLFDGKNTAKLQGKKKARQKHKKKKIHFKYAKVGLQTISELCISQHGKKKGPICFHTCFFFSFFWWARSFLTRSASPLRPGLDVTSASASSAPLYLTFLLTTRPGTWRVCVSRRQAARCRR